MLRQHIHLISNKSNASHVVDQVPGGTRPLSPPWGAPSADPSYSTPGRCPWTPPPASPDHRLMNRLADWYSTFREHSGKLQNTLKWPQKRKPFGDKREIGGKRENYLRVRNLIEWNQSYFAYANSRISVACLFALLLAYYLLGYSRTLLACSLACSPACFSF